ncbi:MAG: hypothetical protein ABI835_11940, partial [Chloroflexota bacterium]
CAACTQPLAAPASETPAPTVPADRSVLLGQAPQGNAPALALSGGDLIAAWVGSDERGVHQDARRVGGNSTGAITTLPLPPTHPYGQQLIPGMNGHTHLLWLDANESGQTTLYSALLASDLSVERGPVSVSEGLALAYSAVADGAGGIWTAWSGGLMAEMAVYVRRSDDEGRPLQTTTLAAAGEHPALVRTNTGEIWLFWLADGALMRQRVEPSTEAQPLTGTISLAPGDQLVNLQAALDASSAYFFWNVTRANGSSETWWTAGALDASVWRQPTRLTSEAGAGLRWVSPATGQTDLAAAAVASDAGLGMITLSGGQVVGYKLVVPGARLIGLPALLTDRRENFVLAWAAPGEVSADLRLMRVEK